MQRLANKSRMYVALIALCFLACLQWKRLCLAGRSGIFAEVKSLGLPYGEKDSSVPAYHDKACLDKKKILEILLNGGKNISQIDCALLPVWQNIVENYGDGPVVHGLDTCEAYRESISNNSHPMLRVAGLFNSGTNAMAALLELNVEELGGNFQHEVPWGKHLPVRFRKTNKFPPRSKVDYRQVMPVVMVREPFRWMKSMCKRSYGVEWIKPNTFSHCPILIPNAHDKLKPRFRGKKTAETKVGLNQVTNTVPIPVEHYDSLASVWTTFYQDWNDVDFPHLVVRFEDILFHGPRLLEILNDCIGMNATQKPFRHKMTQAKKHGRSSDFATALAQYGPGFQKLRGLTQDDINFARVALNSSLLETFHYPAVPLF